MLHEIVASVCWDHHDARGAGYVTGFIGKNGTDPDEAINLADDPAWSAELGHLRDRTVELRKLYAGLVFKDGFESGDLAAWTVAN